MTPFECLRKSPPNLRQLRTWGCRAYVLTPKADRLKDFDAKAHSGIFVGYGKQKMGCEVLLHDTNKMVTSVHAMFNEIFPAHPAGYHTKLEELLGTRHKDDKEGLTYEVRRVAVSREDWIVWYRSLVTAAGVVSREEKVPVRRGWGTDERVCTYPRLGWTTWAGRW